MRITEQVEAHMVSALVEVLSRAMRSPDYGLCDYAECGAESRRQQPATAFTQPNFWTCWRPSALSGARREQGSGRVSVRNAAPPAYPPSVQRLELLPR
jgi:hypothetical protein